MRWARFAPLLALTLAGCGNSPAEFMRPPALSAVGSGLATPPASSEEAAQDIPLRLQGSSSVKPVNLFTDQRIARVGDIVTVNMSINDKATFGNATDRSTAAKTNFAFDWAFHPTFRGTTRSPTTASPRRVFPTVAAAASARSSNPAGASRSTTRPSRSDRVRRPVHARVRFKER